MKAKYTLRDTFNRRTLSTHRTIRAAVLADLKLSRSLRKHSPGSYLPTDVIHTDGSALAQWEVDEIMQEQAAVAGM